MTYKVAIIGAGSVGSAIGGQLLKRGFQVKYAVRDSTSDKVKQLVLQQADASFESVESSLRWSDCAVLAVNSTHDPAKIRELGKTLAPWIPKKVLIDATNPTSAYPGLEVLWDGKSGGEILQEAMPNTWIYKAFNTIGVDHMKNPEGLLEGGQKLTMMIAGGPEQREVVEAVVLGAGFAPVYVGPIRYARNLEALAELWIHLGVPGAGFTPEFWGRNFTFQVVRK